MVSKQLLLKAIAGLTGVATLGLSSLSFAGGEYAPAPAPTPAPIAVAEEGKAGFYVGVRAGYANTYDFKGLKEQTEFFGGKAEQDGFAGGVNVGYAFNKFLGVEAGYLYLPTSKWSINYPLDKGYVNDNLNIKRHAFDISAKATIAIPSAETVGIYGKVGVGFLNTKADFDSNINVAKKNVVFHQEFNSDKLKHNTTTLTYGAGVYWDITPNLRLDGGWQRWNRENSKKHHIDTATAGLSYFFAGGDLFNS